MTEAETGPQQTPSADPDVVVTPDGPYLVSRRLPLRRRHHITSEQGEPLTWSAPSEIERPEGQRYALCRCGGSSHKPSCDNTP